MTTLEQIESFHQFAAEHVRNESGNHSLAELVDLWEMHNRPETEHEENRAAIQAAINDMHAGDNGRDADIVIEELRDQLSESAGE